MQYLASRVGNPLLYNRIATMKDNTEHAMSIWHSYAIVFVNKYVMQAFVNFFEPEGPYNSHPLASCFFRS